MLASSMLAKGWRQGTFRLSRLLRQGPCECAWVREGQMAYQNNKVNRGLLDSHALLRCTEGCEGANGERTKQSQN